MTWKPLAAAWFCIGLVACSHSIDDRQTENHNGLVYKHGDNDPFTGTVTHLTFGPYWGHRCTAQYRDGLIKGEVSCKSESGKLVYRAHFDDRVRDGEEERWSASSGQKVYEATWRAGKLDGRERSWSDDGTPLSDVHLKDGVKDGQEERWTKSGQKYMDFDWDDGKATGYQKAVAEDDRLEFTYDDGLVDDHYKKFESDGSLVWDVPFKKGTIDGEEIWNGRNVHMKRHWKDGKVTDAQLVVTNHTGETIGQYSISCISSCPISVSNTSPYGLSFNVNYSQAKVVGTQWLTRGRDVGLRGTRDFDSDDYDARNILTIDLPGNGTVRGAGDILSAGIDRVETTFNAGHKVSLHAWDKGGRPVLNAAWSSDGTLQSVDGSLWQAVTLAAP